LSPALTCPACCRLELGGVVEFIAGAETSRCLEIRMERANSGQEYDARSADTISVPWLMAGRIDGLPNKRY